MPKCEVCGATNNVQMSMLGLDGYAEFVDDDSCSFLFCKWCQGEVESLIRLFKHNRKEGGMCV